MQRIRSGSAFRWWHLATSGGGFFRKRMRSASSEEIRGLMGSAVGAGAGPSPEATGSGADDDADALGTDAESRRLLVDDSGELVCGVDGQPRQTHPVVTTAARTAAPRERNHLRVTRWLATFRA
jgi:hypothetical protein